MMKIPTWVMGKDFKKTFFRSVIIAGSMIILFKYIIAVVQVETTGMAPTVQKGDWVFISRISTPSIQDVVAIRLAGESILHLSRVVASPGDTFKISQGKAFLNGKPLNINHIPKKINYKTIELKNDEYFVMGDNRNMSIKQLHLDGSFGKVSKSRMIGVKLF